ncbi:hypothetical protein SAMN05444397_10799 [Flavobacterium aquidurense]|uniref:Uncharacterized protein n=1 Tax=Flavobacterium frigidimaris TaxID=262320 RepID=A0ABX4BWK8_FLAFR|nr:hypothetical protein [Flavobacterium frigidimaris]OXA82579.1 hypothetical protein B0A65_00845 [Flavobacterium frigidimaris]SDZ46555.1 hypothetical protein SAMN05444397_10799 [Flavobacterium aquidurense]
MAAIFEKLKLREQFEYQLEIDKDVFFDNLKQIVDKGNSSDLFSRQFDKYIDGDNDYIGSVYKDNFRIRKRYELFNNNSSIAIGKINIKNNTVSISTSVTAFNHSNVYAPIVFLVLYVGFSILGHSHFPELFLIFFRSITILYISLIVLLFVLMRKAVANLSSELEADFDFIQIKNKKNQ